ncbi:hypothetical protein [Chenggangzhangella methanolivorans]|uniref:LysM domain-containing protein n=1 Tax=Chenggangzhangella methanolivorans TaxID=1437009 RepID=A0A9E6R5B7_9HYPH|nr:hypothetical protein [Chenggangzhangella methanolivorans]QZN98477.1 hypothetical protein K6K41_15545 [Chenggangzhangella methanolivorans]
MNFPVGTPVYTPPPPPPRTAEQRRLDQAIAAAAADRSAAGGSGELGVGEIPHPIQVGDTMTGVSTTYDSPLPGLIGANPQVRDPNLIYPDQVLFVPTSDGEVVEQRTDVQEAEQADAAVESYEEIQRDPQSSPGDRKMAAMELPTARSNASARWTEVRSGVEEELRHVGAASTFPVNDKVQDALADIRARAPESDGFQREVDAAFETVSAEWRENRTTGDQLEQLVGDARRQDEAVRSLEETLASPDLGPERRLYQMELGDARSAASQNWGLVEDAVGRELTHAGGAGLFPDEAARPTLEALRELYPNDAQFQEQVTDARETLGEAWRAAGTTTPELAGLVENYQSARSNLQSLEEFAASGEPGARNIARADIPDAQSQLSTTRSELSQEIQGTLRTLGEGKPYPEEAMRATYDQLRARLPNDPDVREIADEAWTSVTEEWAQQGWTRETLGAVIGEYEDYAGAQRSVEAAQDAGPAGRADVPELQRIAGERRGEAVDEAREQIQAAADAVPEEQKEEAAVARAMLLSNHGPQDEAYQQIVADAVDEVLVTPRVEAVEAAYEEGGASAAAAELAAQTEAVSPETASRVVEGSSSTIDRIAQDIGAGTADYDGGVETGRTYADLAIATDKASQAADGQEVVDGVAEAIAEHVPDELMVGFDYSEGARLSVMEGGGAALSLSLANAFKAKGQNDNAMMMLGSVQGGLRELQYQSEEAVKDFQEATAVPVQLQRDWGGIMSPEQAEAAMAGYVEQNPEVLEDFNRTYGRLEELGYAAERTMLTLDDEALASVDGIETAGELKDLRDEIVNDDNVTLVRAESEPARTEVIEQVIREETERIVAEEEAAGQVGEGEDGASAPSLPKQAQGSLKELGNSLMVVSSASAAADAADVSANPRVTPLAAVDDFFGSGRAVSLEPTKVTNFGGAMNGLGAAFNGLAAYSAFDTLASGEGALGDRVKAVYYSTGVAKEAAEGLAFMTSRGWLGRVSASPAAQRLATSVLPSINSSASGLGHITQQPGWIKFGTFVKTAGALIDAGYAIDSVANGDYPAAGLYTASAAGGGLMTLSGVGAIGAWGGPVGAGVVLVAGGALYFYKDAKEKAKFEEPSREYLEAAGLDPDLAEKLANYSDSDGTPAGPGIAATIRQFGVDPGTMIDTLNGMSTEEIEVITEAAHTVTPNDQGDFQVTAENDYEVWGPEGKDPQFGGHYLYDPDNTRYRGEYGASTAGVTYLTDPNPRSLTALRDMARAATGEQPFG